MNKIQQTIKEFLEKYNLNNPENTYLCAFSGGYDSMCLLHSLKQISPQNRIIAIHLNHNWRGEESNQEEENCKNFCKEISVEFYSEKLSSDIPHTETAARDARYEFFETCSKKFNSKIIFTAHNKNDNAETLIYRICKGTGIRGLCGIAENREIYYRPLLSISREKIEKYCTDFNLKPNNDSSNSDTTYKRNFIRTEILPKLNKKINPNTIDMINSLSNAAKEDSAIVEEYLNQLYAKIKQNNKIKTQEFVKLSFPTKKRIIYNLFIENNLDYDNEKITNILEHILNNATSKSGKTCSLTTNLWIFTNNQFIEIINKKNEKTPTLQIKKEGKYETPDYIFTIEKYNQKTTHFPKDNEYTAIVNFENFDFDFELRTRQDGDIIQPFGMSGTQKLKKYLNEKKVPQHEKSNILLLTQNKEVLWATGLGISDKIKVTKNPTHKLTIEKKRG